VTFKRSIDGGETWPETFSPSGFAAPLTNQFFGEFRAEKATTEYGPGRVLINSWNPADSTYYVWASDDNGTTWERKGKIYKPQSFLRMDLVLGEAGEANFLNLLPGPVKSNELDVALPDRYKDRA
jgi:hypothetical protein